VAQVMLDQGCNDTRKCSRFYMIKKTQNDIIILFSDAEVGLNGAALFVTQHQWAKKLDLVLNFEARIFWTKYMLMKQIRECSTCKRVCCCKSYFPFKFLDV
jgi:hypothetical protein